MYDNTNRLSLWLNKDRKSQNHPHLKGQGETNMPVWASAWFSNDLSDEDKATISEIIKRHSQSSKKPFLTVSMTPKDARSTQSNPQGGYESNDIPFSPVKLP